MKIHLSTRIPTSSLLYFLPMERVVQCQYCCYVLELEKVMMIWEEAPVECYSIFHLFPANDLL